MSSDFDDDELSLDDDSFEDFDKSEKTLGHMWQNNPLFKFGTLALAAVVVFGAVFYFGQEKVETGQSVLPRGSEVSAPPGTEEASPNYIEAVEEENEARIEEAFSQGGSALPTPIDPPQQRLSVPTEEVEKEDPLQRWRQLQEERLQRELQQAQTAPPAVAVQSEVQSETIQNLAQSFSQQMQAVLEQRYRTTVRTQSVTDPSDFYTDLSGGGGDQNVSGNAGSNTGSNFFEDDALESFQNVLLPAGEILYAQLLLEANSDIPGPILAQIVSGPLAGGRLIGSFSVEDEFLVLRFQTLVIDGVSLTVDSVAVDPGTTLTGLATDIDHRYIQRVLFPMAAAFVEGAAEAISESGRTTITVNGETVSESEEETDTEQEVASGIEEAGEELRDLLDEMADVEPLIRVEAGTPMGILFLQPVVEDENAI